MHRFAQRLWLVSIVVLIALTATASSTIAALFPRLAASDADEPAKLKDLPELKPLKYRLLGPAWGGRGSRARGVPGNPNVYYAAAASGGVWKSVDGGLTWNSVFDEQPVSSIGSIAVAPSDPNVIYAGSGEANIRGNVGAGNGIYRSLDGGKTWTHVWKQEGQIGTMVVHPRNADIAFAAVLGHAFGPNPERGVYRTKDGGKTWEQILKKDEWTGASDVALDPSNPNIVFAGLWQARRRPWELTSGGPGSGLYVSRDGGDTWKQLTGDGLPSGVWGKTGIAVAPSDGSIVYALIEADEGGLFRSDDGGEKWTRVSGNHELRQRAWYYSTLTVNPRDPNDMWCPQVAMLHSIDGGKTFQHVEKIHHGDHHDIWIDPLNPKRMIASNDGGVDISTDGGASWDAPPLPIGQFYHVSVDTRVPFRVAGALQDIGTAQGPSNSLSRAGIRNTDWYNVGGGEAGWVVSDPADPNIVYAGEYGGYISRYDHRTRQARNVSIYPDNPSGHGGEDMKYRFQWTAPIAASPHDPKVIYHGGNALFKSTDGGQSWTAISPDLTRNDKSKEQWSGGPITGDNTGVETYCTIFVVAESPVQKGLIWAGTDDGLVHVTQNGGANWKNVTGAMPGFPEWGTVSMIEPSHFDAGTACVVVDAHRLDDMRPYLYKTTDFGQSWKRLDGNLPQDIYLHAVREDPARRGMLYLGTERGVAFTKDDGATWNSLKLNLPTVAVHDLQVKDNRLVLATHGRSMWIFDDLLAVRELSSKVTDTSTALVGAPDAIRWRYNGEHRGRWSADNPPSGAFIYYWLKEKPKGDVTIEILDPHGAVVDTLSSKPEEPIRSSEYVEQEEKDLKKRALSTDAGVNRAVWDLRWKGAEMIRGGILDAGYPRTGPMAVPGSYTARLTVGGKTSAASFQVLPDPRVKASEADLAQQLRFALEVRDSITSLTRTVSTFQSIRQQLAARNELLKDTAAAGPLVKSSKELMDKLDQLNQKLQNPKAEAVYDILAKKGGAKLYSRLSPLFDWANDSDGAPTQGMRESYDSEKKELEEYRGELKRLIDADLASLNATASKLKLPTTYIRAVP